jgi:excisionase family DNA binding protein
MMNQSGGLMAQSTPGVKAPPPAAAAAAGGPALLSPAEAAQVLGVAESDVLASLEAGDLKGKRIGSQWRITRAAIDSFLAS